MASKLPPPSCPVTFRKTAPWINARGLPGIARATRANRPLGLRCNQSGRLPPSVSNAQSRREPHRPRPRRLNPRPRLLNHCARTGKREFRSDFAQCQLEWRTDARDPNELLRAGRDAWRMGRSRPRPRASRRRDGPRPSTRSRFHSLRTKVRGAQRRSPPDPTCGPNSGRELRCRNLM